MDDPKVLPGFIIDTEKYPIVIYGHGTIFPAKSINSGYCERWHFGELPPFNPENIVIETPPTKRTDELLKLLEEFLA